MRKLLTGLVSGGLLFAMGIVVADEHEGDAAEPNVATPVETFSCKFNEGKGQADLDVAIKKWNAWADKEGIDDYSAWTLTSYYSGPDQDFDVLWLGGSEKAKTLGRIQDTWLGSGGKAAEAFDEAISCNAHGNFAVLQMKAPPKRDDPSNIVISFSDCNVEDGASFGDLYEPIIEWGKYRGDNGSTAGMWVFFPAYGGGGEEFDFKFVSAYQNLEDQGADYDQYNEGGWQKGEELFAGKLNCDSSRVYLATNQRMAKDDD